MNHEAYAVSHAYALQGSHYRHSLHRWPRLSYNAPLPDSDATKTFVDPIFRIAFLLIKLFHSLLCQFWILDFQHTLITHLSQPLLERLSLVRRNGLNDTEQASSFINQNSLRKITKKSTTKALSSLFPAKIFPPLFHNMKQHFFYLCRKIKK